MKQKMYAFWMKEEGDLMEYLNAFNCIICDLSSIDVKIEEEDRVLMLLTLLPPSFKHLVMTLLYGKETLL